MKNILYVILFLFTSILHSNEGVYFGAKYDKITLDRETVDGYDLNKFATTSYDVIDLHIGKEIKDKFYVEGGYFFSTSKEKVTGSQTVSGVTISGSIETELDGFRGTAGYKHSLANNLAIKPNLNLYIAEESATAALTASAGSRTATASAEDSDSASFFSAGLTVSYKIMDKLEAGVTYTTNLSDIDGVDSYETLGLSLSFNF